MWQVAVRLSVGLFWFTRLPAMSTRMLGRLSVPGQYGSPFGWKGDEWKRNAGFRNRSRRFYFLRSLVPQLPSQALSSLAFWMTRSAQLFCSIFCVSTKRKIFSFQWRLILLSVSLRKLVTGLIPAFLSKRWNIWLLIWALWVTTSRQMSILFPSVSRMLQALITMASANIW